MIIMLKIILFFFTHFFYSKVTYIKKVQQYLLILLNQILQFIAPLMSQAKIYNLVVNKLINWVQTID